MNLTLLKKVSVLKYKAREKLKKKMISCPECGQVFSRGSTFWHHYNRRHLAAERRLCNICTEHFETDAERERHIAEHAERTEFFAPLRSAFQRRCATMQRVLESAGDLDTAWSLVREQLRVLLTARLVKRRTGLKYGIIIYVHMVQNDQHGNIVDEVVSCLRSRNRQLYKGDNVSNSLNEVQEELDERLDQVLEGGSGWNLMAVTAVNIELGCPVTEWEASCTGIASKTYLKKIPGHKHLIDISVKRRNHSCFLIAFVQAFIKGEISLKERKEKTLEWIAKLDYGGMKMPMKITSLLHFEKRNEKLGMGVNVLAWQKGNVFPLYGSKMPGHWPRANLLLLETKKGWHFSYIADLGKFTSRISRQRKRKHICDNCFSRFTLETALLKHRKICMSTSYQIVEYPEKESYAEFRNYAKQVKMPIIGFADFETKLVPVTSKENGLRFNCSICLTGKESGKQTCHHKTVHLSDQMPLSYYMVFLETQTGRIVEQSFCRKEEDLMSVFFDELEKISQRLEEKRNRFKEAPLVSLKELNSPRCYLCKKIFGREDWRVRDHCHYSGQFLGMAHGKCNVDRQEWRQKIPVFLHNLSNFDSHLLISGLSKWQGRRRMRLEGLPFNSERFRTLTVNNIQFIDSLHFLSASLDELVKDLSTGMHEFKILKENLIHRHLAKNELELISRKGFYPYEWTTSLKLLQETKIFPDRNSFFSVLRGQTISEEDWKHAKRVYDTFQCRNMEDYMELYLRTDVLLLAEVFCAFREAIYEKFNLDPAHYISLPQLSWDMCLSMTGCQLLIPSDPDMHLLPEVNIRGGLSFAGLRHAQCNHDREQIIYIDANNLYGGTMMQKLPFDEYSWLDASEINQISWRDVTPEDEYAYMVECDLEYPTHLHDAHDSFPLAPETRNISFADLSPYSKKVLECLRGEKEARNYKATKLCATLYDKKNYVCHSLNLQFYLETGLKLRAVHRVLKFRQREIFAPYVQEMTRLRKNSQSKFQTNMWKRAVNTIFGKTLASERKHQNVKFGLTQSQVDRYLTSPSFENFKIIGEDLGLFFMKKAVIGVKKPFLIGFSILELSKLFMAKLYYEQLVPKLGNISVIFSDTDSFCLKVYGLTREEMLSKLEPLMDFSNYPTDSKYFNASRKSELGYVKDESGGVPIKEVISLRSKCYHITHRESELVKATAKGVNKNAQKNLTRADYLKCVYEPERVFVDLYNIRSKNQNMHTVKERKIALSSFDDKRLILECGVHTRALGNVKTSQACEKCAAFIQRHKRVFKL